ncbi:MAG: riboflavin synthase [Verrucomicrobiaceae bacterium]|nr:riboflavin synthase [Verrucomicrobiaceae bacterium]
MFTGLVEQTGRIITVEPRSGGARLQVEAGAMAKELSLGESVAVNGCCLTVTDQQQGIVSFDLLEQTLRVSNLGDLIPGDEVNLERAMGVGARFGGHFVQGHVDATVKILRWEKDGADHRLEVTIPAEGRGLVIPKGSICLDGISLTAAEVNPDRVVCWIIPHTLQMTNLKHRVTGQRLNVEWDMLGKYVSALLEARQA